jgi:hypothetical protein
MSGWDGYVNGMMKDTGFFDNAAIFGKEGYTQWASTEHFEVTQAEVAEMLETLQAGKGAQSPAISVAGVHYAPVLVEINRIYAEKVSNVNAGVLVLVGKQSVVIGTYPPQVQPGLAIDAIERLMIYLGEQGF